MAIRAAAIALLIPILLFAALLLVPGFDQPWGTFAFHFYVVSAASLLAAATCALLVLSARSIRETRILFLALTFLSLGTIFSIHGLTTPGHIYHLPSAALERSPWLATLAAGFFAALSVVSIPRIIEQSRLRLPEATFACCGAVIASYFMISLLFPDWLTGFPTREEWFQHSLTSVTLGLLAFAAYRYLDSYLFTRLPSQLAVTVGLLFIAEAQVSLDFGVFWQYSWWLYHGLFLAAFASVLGGWTWELLRARDARSIAEAIAMRDALAQLNRGRPSPLVTLADQIENHDLETHRHVDRVAAYALSIGRHMGFGTARLRDLVLAAQMHDIGKIGLPPYILTKAGKLTDTEWDAIKQHPGKGWEIIARLRGLQHIAGIIRHHHERFDGAGYPDRIGGEEIPLEARIISVADTFDALTSERPYRRALSADDAKLELLRVAGSQLDPACVQAFIKSMQTEGVRPRPIAGPVAETAAS